jgi:hypothetical protein
MSCADIANETMISRTLARVLIALALVFALPPAGVELDPCDATAHHEVSCDACGSLASISSAWLTPARIAPQAVAAPAPLPVPLELRSVRLDRPPLAPNG